MLTCAFWSVSVLQPFATCLISDCQYTAKKAVKASTQHQSRTRGVTVLLNRILIPCLVGATHEGPHLSRSGAPVGASSPLELRSARRRGSLIETWRPRGCYWPRVLKSEHAVSAGPALKPAGAETKLCRFYLANFRLPRCVSLPQSVVSVCL